MKKEILNDNSLVLHAYTIEKDIDKSVARLEWNSEDDNSGRIEEMLHEQATVLNGIFLDMALTAKSTPPYNIEKYMHLAFKAQERSQKTLEALARIRTPNKVIQNFKAEYQQVNNG